jgi:hypothetical protein
VTRQKKPRSRFLLPNPQTGKRGPHYDEEKFFLYELAAKLGMTVKQLLSSMTQNELREWAAYKKIAGIRYSQGVKKHKGRGAPVRDYW